MSFNNITANLLSTENLTVVMHNEPSASFDVDKRILYLPTYNAEFEGAVDMVTCHEVGHAKYTLKEFNEIFQATNDTMRQYYNIVEDARIEKLMKREYPGLRKVMAEGYNLLIERNMFVPEGVEINEMSFIDRINLYFKAGHKYRISFTNDERELVEEVANCETWQEVVDMAERIYEFAKAQAEEKLEKREVMVKSKGDDGEGDPKDLEEFEESDEYESYNSFGSEGANDVDKELKSITQDSIDEQLKAAANTNITVQNFTIQTKFENNMIKPYKEILKDLQTIQVRAGTSYENYKFVKAIDALNVGDALKDWDKFYASTSRTVNNMHKEFEMKKCAHRLRNAKTSRSGSLNMNRIFQYKLRDDIFKNVTIVADDTNHGMLFLLDWSGSMTNVIHNTICQVIALTMFCRRAKIPHKVFAFSNHSGVTISDHSVKQAMIDKNTVNTILALESYDCRLLEFITNEMNEREYTLACKLLFSGVMERAFSLSGTPLVPALVYMHKYVNEYKVNNRIEKLTLVVLTDGESCNPTYVRIHPEGGKYSTTLVPYNGCVQNIIDPITKDIHKVDRDAYSNTLLKMIGKSSGANIVGFYVTKPGEVRGLVRVNFPSSYQGAAYHLIDRIKTGLYSNGYYIVNAPGYDQLYAIRDISLNMKEHELSLDGDKTAAQLAKEMTKFSTVNVTNKVLMNKVITYFA